VNRIIRLAIRLYPACWRRRYGPELEALIEESSKSWPTVLDLVRGAVIVRLFTVLGPFDWRRSIVVCGLLGAVIGTLASFTSQARYAYTSIIEIETSDQAPPSPARTVAEQAFNDKNLDNVARQFGLYANDQNAAADLIQQVRADMSVTATAPGAGVQLVQIGDREAVPFRDQGALHVTFRYPDRRKAQQVTARLASLVIDENARQPSRSRYRVAGLPHEVVDRASTAALTGVGLGAGIVVGLAIAALRRFQRT
jgi:hypothetical protein